jgi:hypothetical protein
MPQITAQAWTNAMDALIREGLATQAGSRVQIVRSAALADRERSKGGMLF